MSIWGKGIYHIDSALDYFSTITDRIEREFAFQFSPEQITAEYWWVVRVIKVVEMALLLNQHTKYNVLYDSTVTSVQRWQKDFFTIWDGDWTTDENFPFNTPDDRKAKRTTVVVMFTQLEDMARSWADQNYEGIELESLLTPLSDKTISRLKTEENKEYILQDRFVWDLIDQLVKEVIYWLSAEKRRDLLGFFFGFEDPIVAADLLACICEAYRTTRQVNQTVIQNWRNTYLGVMKQAFEESKLELDQTGERFKAVVAVFDKLEAVAQKYPSQEW